MTAAPLTKPDTFHWEWEGHTIKVAYETFGTGRPVLLLPVFSTVSSRAEMRPLAELLAARGRCCQLKLYKDGTRKAPGATSPTLIMQAIAAQLSAEDIANTAAYFASLPGAAVGAKSPQLPKLAKTGVTFPEGYKESFTKYHTVNVPATKQVRYYYANKAAVAAAKAGKPLPDGSVLFVEVYAAKLDGDKPVTGGDGFFVADKLLLYTAMAREVGWGKDIPEMLRNDNWNYAIFTADKQHRAGVNQAECLACHKPLNNVSYTFTLKQLTEAK